MRFGVTTIPNVPWDELVSRWRAVDALPGIESLWIPDHLFKGWYECWAALGGLACATTRVRLGPLVSPLTSHEPARLARAAVTLDEASGGRLELGIGSGGASRRFEGWTAELADALGDRRIPLTVGGYGETGLRVAARFAHRWNISPDRGVSRDEARALARERNARLDELCADTGRTVLRSALIAYPFEAETPFASDDAWAEFVGAWEDVGFEELILDYPPRNPGERGLVEKVFGSG